MSADIEQRTDEWRAERAGKITASRFADAIAMDKRNGKSTQAREKYKRELVAEILSGQPKHEVNAQSLSWGRDIESFAREAFEVETGLIVIESGFCLHPKYNFIGGSPDGLVGDDAGYESKCPLSEDVHILTMMDGMPEAHIGQVQGCMFITGRKRWHFISYDPRQSERFRLYHQTIDRDDKYINEVLEPGLLQFWAEVQQLVQRLQLKAA